MKVAESSTPIIRSVLSGLVGAALGMMITYTTAVATNGKEIVRLATKVERLSEDIKSNMDNRYRSIDALRDFKNVEDRMRSIETNDVKLEKELDIHIRKHNDQAR